MTGLAAFAFAIVAFALVAEATSPGVVNATTRAG